MFKKILLTSVAAGAIFAASSAAHAGAFALREQSAAGQGMSFAGAAAGGAGLSSMFWNPATMTDFQGIQASANGTLILPFSKLTNDTGTGSGYTGLGASNSGNEGLSALVPSGYVSWQISDSFWAGLSVNAPFGLATKPDAAWSGRIYNSTTSIASLNVAPTIAYKFNEMVSVAAGVSYMSLKAKYTSGLPTTPNPSTWTIMGMKGDGSAWGFNLGATIKPTSTTEIGIGYRSQMSVKVDGDFSGYPLNPAYNAPVKTAIPLPQSINVGVRQKINAEWTLLGGLEWTDWSVLQAPSVTYASSGAAHTLLPSIPFYYKDGWYASLGGEYKWNANLTMRAGLGYEWTPVRDAERSARLPDNDRLWASAGFGYKVSDKLNLDFGYTRIIPKSTMVTINANNHNHSQSPSLASSQLDVLFAKVDSHVDIVSLGITYRFDTPAPATRLPGKVTK